MIRHRPAISVAPGKKAGYSAPVGFRKELKGNPSRALAREPELPPQL